MAQKLSVLIVGAGTKGAFGPVSHAAAFKAAGFDIVGFVDPDLAKAQQAATQWGGEAFTSLEAATKYAVDVVTVTTPDQTHEAVLAGLFNWPRLVFAEKPFCQSTAAAKAFLHSFQTCGQSVCVNYTRRFVPGFHLLKDTIPHWGSFLGGTAFYGKGLHNLCHWVDTFLMLDLDPMAIQYIDIDRAKLNVFEAVLYFEAGRLDIRNFGQRWEFTPSCDREDYPQDRVLVDGQPLHHDTGLDLAMEIAVSNITNHLISGAPLLSTSENAVKVLKICEALAS
jgi:hypothetical protein